MHSDITQAVWFVENLRFHWIELQVMTLKVRDVDSPGTFVQDHPFLWCLLYCLPYDKCSNLC